MLCPFCKKAEPVLIDISSLNLRICPCCKASFLAEEHIPEFRRTLFDTTKTYYMKSLKQAPEVSDAEYCLDHNKPLENSIVAGFGFEALKPKCCSILHLKPSIMEKIISAGFGTYNIKRTQTKRNFVDSLARIFGGVFFAIWKKKNPVVEDEVDRLQYNMKFKKVLEANS